MDFFTYKGDKLYCEELPVADIAGRVGTPFYLYSGGAISHSFLDFDRAFADIEHITCFAVKSCSNLSILGMIAKMGGGADIVSGGELFRVLKAGMDCNKVVYSGVGKTESEIREALLANILMFNIESEQELDLIQKCAADLQIAARVAFRVNPNVDPQTHPYISTGLAENKFGLSLDKALAEYVRASKMKNIEVVGVSCHIGSQLTKVSPFVDALAIVRAFIDKLSSLGIEIKYLDLGGGLGIVYKDEAPPTPQEYAKAIKDGLQGFSGTLILEPGRIVVGNGGVLVTEVQFIKTNDSGAQSKKFVIIDAAMNDLLRPSLYGGYHQILPLEKKDTETETVDVVGPICETGDFLAKDRALPELERGDLLAVMSGGAYGFSMSSTYNSRPRVAEVMVRGHKFNIIRKREEYADLIVGESLLED